MSGSTASCFLRNDGGTSKSKQVRAMQTVQFQSAELCLVLATGLSKLPGFVQIKGIALKSGEAVLMLTHAVAHAAEEMKINHLPVIQLVRAIAGNVRLKLQRGRRASEWCNGSLCLSRRLHI